MISKNKLKVILSLSQKKIRDELGLFVAEGTKLVLDLIPTFKLKECYATKEWLAENSEKQPKNVQEISFEDLKKISNQKSPQGIIALFEKPIYRIEEANHQQLTIALDDIQDPGNLGTIIRIADWFGIRTIICSLLTADAFGPKTVQSTMGALARVKVYYTDLEHYLKLLPRELPIYGTFMEGESIYTEKLTENGLIVMGNEGNGISPAIAKLINRRLTIPNYPKNEATSESLNVAVATSIVCSEFRRRLLK